MRVAVGRSRRGADDANTGRPEPRLHRTALLRIAVTKPTASETFMAVPSTSVAATVCLLPTLPSPAVPLTSRLPPVSVRTTRSIGPSIVRPLALASVASMKKVPAGPFGIGLESNDVLVDGHGGCIVDNLREYAS
jgi:hypothetical protein